MLLMNFSLKFIVLLNCKSSIILTDWEEHEGIRGKITYYSMM